jgi:hypothetical protein
MLDLIYYLLAFDESGQEDYFEHFFRAAYGIIEIPYAIHYGIFYGVYYGI